MNTKADKQQRSVGRLMALILLSAAVHTLFGQTPPERLLLKDYRPKSIYRIPTTEIRKARYPVIDIHSHPYAMTPEEISQWVENMNEVGIEKTIILSRET